jgi:hypothetical protein
MLCKLGATDEEMAKCLGVNEATLYRWQKAHPEFRKAIRAGKMVADMKIASSLHSIATGFEYDEAQPIKLKEITYENGKKVSETERVEMVKVRRKLPPDTAAAILWLTNRQKERWKHRVTSEQTGEGGGAVQIEDVIPEKVR